MARRTFPDPDRADSYFELLDDPVRPAPVDRVALAESELRRLGLDDAEVRADGDTATVLLPGTALSTSPESVLESEVARAVRSAGFGSAIVVRVGGTAPDRQPGSGDPAATTAPATTTAETTSGNRLHWTISRTEGGDDQPHGRC